MTQMYEDGHNVSLLAIDQYMRGVRWSERLAEEEEAQMIQCVERGKVERMKEWSDQEVLNLAKHAYERLVEGYQPYVIVVARGLAGRCRRMETMDLIQEGNIALMSAIEAHDPSRGYPLRTLVGVRVRSAMVHALAEMNGVARVSWRGRKAIAEVRQVQRDLSRAFGCEPSYCELASQLGWTLEHLLEVMEWGQCERIESLQGLLREDEEEDRRDFIGMFQMSLHTASSGSCELEQTIQQAISGALTGRQREVVSALYGFGDGVAQEGSLSEIGRQFGVSSASVQMTHVRAKRRLQAALASVVGVAQESAA